MNHSSRTRSADNCARYEIYRKGEDKPFQTGKTDALGRIVFLPDRQAAWRVRAFSEDGHGTDFTIDAGPAEAAGTAQGPAPDYMSLSKIVFGIVMILLVFLIVLRVIKRRAG